MKLCAKDGCNATTAGKSKYCAPHREAARAAWVEMIASKGDDKAAREKKWQDLHDRAYAAGMAAGEAHMPTPMIVEQHANPLDDNSPVVRRYAPVASGVCGFAWVNIKPGNSSFALYLVKRGLGRTDSYYGGVTVWVSEFGQSMECKQAFAAAYAQVVKAELPNGRVYAQSRMD